MMTKTAETLLEAETKERQETRLRAEKLKLILARLERAVAHGLPLSPDEENLLAELERRKYMNPRESIHVDSDGTVRVNKAVNVEPVMEAMKAYGDFIDRYSSRKRAQRMVGALDPLTAANWARESGTKIGTKEFAKFCMQRIKNDIDYRGFRVGG